MTEARQTEPPVLNAVGLTKRFGDLVANDEVDLSMWPGEIHAVVGENGAGKTTLMRMLSGEIQPDSGVIEVRGEAVRLTAPQDAVRAGIGMVHQHYSVVGDFSLLDNLMLGIPGGSARAITRSELTDAVNFLVEEGFENPESTTVRNLSVDELQRFEIARLLYVGSDILILDEPTAVLGPIEIERLYERLRGLASEGRSIVVITHKLGEVKSYADRVTVMRAGRTVVSATSGMNREEMLAAMFGDHMAVAEEQRALGAHHELHTIGNAVLEIEALSVKGHDGRLRVEELSFSLRRGEILCVIGVEGNGQTSLMEALAGLTAAEGAIRVNGVNVTKDSPRARFHHGVRFVSEDRLRWDVLKEGSVAENLMAHNFADGHSLGHTDTRGKTVMEFMLSALERFDVRPRAPKMRLGNLSGGNQQRTVVARESSGEKKVLLLSHPTRGLDVVGAAKIVDDTLEQRSRGTAIVWNTADIDEAFMVADTFLVMFRGRAALLIGRNEATRDKIALAMSGSTVS